LGLLNSDILGGSLLIMVGFLTSFGTDEVEFLFLPTDEVDFISLPIDEVDFFKGFFSCFPVFYADAGLNCLTDETYFLSFVAVFLRGVVGISRDIG
jgi:hypothetical protein